MYTIKKEFCFSAGHRLTELPPEHPCSKIHGHNYVVTMELKSKTLDRVGMVMDYRRLESVKQYIDSALDHKLLNDVLPFNPTAENIAMYIYELFKETIPYLTAVEVSETPKTTARYEQDDKSLENAGKAVTSQE